MTMTTLDFIPADTLFFRDARPLQAGSGYGRGAAWPLPGVLHSALRTALLRMAGSLPDGKSADGFVRPRQRDNGRAAIKIGAAEFQWLNLQGPFPVDGNGCAFFPMPRDLAPGPNGTAARLRPDSNASAENNLPAMLPYRLASYERPSKTGLGDWVDTDFLSHYLADDIELPSPKKITLWDAEPRIGVAIDPDSQAAAEGRLYAAEHLRLRRDIRLRFAVAAPPDHKPQMPGECNLTAPDLDGTTLQLGGEQRFGQIARSDSPLVLPSASVRGRRVKWLLLTPAVFAHGWRPGWIGDHGEVKLRVVPPRDEKRRQRRRDRRQEGWRYDEAQDDAVPIRARLVAACIGKPQVIGGWELLGETSDAADGPGRAKGTFLAVPAGSVFYFEATGDNRVDEAARLATVLQARCRSDFYGEKGFGLGVCGTWDFYKRPSQA